MATATFPLDSSATLQARSLKRNSTYFICAYFICCVISSKTLHLIGENIMWQIFSRFLRGHFRDFCRKLWKTQTMYPFVPKTGIKSQRLGLMVHISPVEIKHEETNCSPTWHRRSLARHNVSTLEF